MTNSPDFLSCDWGTTSFRLRWITGSDLKVAREIRENAGVKSLYEEAVESGAEARGTRGDLFASFLSRKLAELFVSLPLEGGESRDEISPKPDFAQGTPEPDGPSSPSPLRGGEGRGEISPKPGFAHEAPEQDGASSPSPLRGERAGVRGLLPLLGQVHGEGASPSPQPLPLVISGMASSTIGWRELPYARAPFPLDGRGLGCAQLDWAKPDCVGPTFLISGLATEFDMMRGEETEIIGLLADPDLEGLRRRSLLILPGTHSKHVRIENGAVVDFRTFMTGELFEVMGRHSILRATLDLAGSRSPLPLAPPHREAFLEGVRWAESRGLAGGLFRARTRAVLGRCPAEENTWFFSGLLIGSELQNLLPACADCPIILGGAHPFSELYSLALEKILAGKAEWLVLPPETVARATIAAHALILRNQAMLE